MTEETKMQNLTVDIDIPADTPDEAVNILRGIFTRGCAYMPSRSEDFAEKFMLALWGAVVALAVQHFWGC
jgi:hypothetical protein